MSLFYQGGGVALLYASKVLENLQTKNEDERRGVQIIQNALKVCAVATLLFFVTLIPFTILTLPGKFSLFLILYITCHRHQHIQ